MLSDGNAGLETVRLRSTELESRGFPVVPSRSSSPPPAARTGVAAFQSDTTPPPDAMCPAAASQPIRRPRSADSPAATGRFLSRYACTPCFPHGDCCWTWAAVVASSPRIPADHRRRTRSISEDGERRMIGIDVDPGCMPTHSSTSFGRIDDDLRWPIEDCQHRSGDQRLGARARARAQRVLRRGGSGAQAGRRALPAHAQ